MNQILSRKGVFMFKSERCNKIMDLLKVKKLLSLDYLCTELFCSKATLRRDLIELEEMGLIHRKRGGVSLVVSGNNEYSYTFRDMENRAAKLYICQLAADYLSDGMCIFMDSSSTVLNICPYLKEKKHITVVTNGIATAFNLIENQCAETYISGGYIKNASTSIVGEHAANFFDKYKADLAILSCRGIDKYGLYEANQQQAFVKQHMMANAKKTIVLCDSSKWGQSFFYKLTSFQNISAIITEAKPHEDILAGILINDCEVIY